MKKYLGLHNKINIRYYIVYSIIICSFLVILISLYKITIFDNNMYSRALDKKTSVTYIGEKGIRGNIYDRNNKLIVGNKEVNIITYTKNEDSTYKEELKTAKKLSEIIELDYKDINKNDIKEYYYMKNREYMEAIINKKIHEKMEKNIIDENQYKNYIYSLITDEKLKIIDEADKKIAYIYKLMNEGYSYDYKIIKNENVTEEEIANIKKEYLNGIEIKVRYERYYPYNEIFRTFLGDLGKIPAEEKNRYLNSGYSLNDIVGVSYLEKEYETILKGKNEIYKVNANGEKEIIEKSGKGNDIVLSIDIELQKQIENIIYEEIINAKYEANTKYYDKSFAIIADSNTGEIIASAGVGGNYINNGWQKIDYLTDIINYSITPGSIVKGASHIVGYNEGTISFGHSVIDSCIQVLNTPKKCSWRRLGYIDDLDALVYSSNYYQFLIAINIGKGSYYYNGPLALDKSGFKTYRKIYNSFGLGVKTGIDLPNENVGYQGNDSNSGSLLDFPIGQYDTYTPMGILQYIMTLSNDGTRIAPHYLKSVYEPDLTKKLYDYETRTMGVVNTKIEYIRRVQEGLKGVMERGTGYGYVDLKFNPYGKTGTAQSFIDTNNDGEIDTETMSSSFGFYSIYNNQKISMVVLSPNVSDLKTSYISGVNSKITRKISDLYFEK